MKCSLRRGRKRFSQRYPVKMVLSFWVCWPLRYTSVVHQAVAPYSNSIVELTNELPFAGDAWMFLNAISRLPGSSSSWEYVTRYGHSWALDLAGKRHAAKIPKRTTANRLHLILAKYITSFCITSGPVSL